MAVTSSESGASTAYNVHVHFLGWKGPLSTKIASSSTSSTTTCLINSSSSTTHTTSSSNIYHHPKLQEQEETGSSGIHQTNNTALDNHGKSHTLRFPYRHRLVQPQEYLFAHLVYRCPLLERAHVAMSASCVVMQKQDEEGCGEMLSSTERGESSTPNDTLLPRICSMKHSSSSSRMHDEIFREGGEKRSNEEEEEEEESMEGELECALRTVLDCMLENSPHSDVPLVDGEAGHSDENREDGAGGQRRKGKGYRCCAGAGRKTLEKIAKLNKMETNELFYPYVQLPFALVEKQLREEYVREQAERARTFYAQLVPPFANDISTSFPSSLIKNNEMVYFDIIITMDRTSFEYIVQYYSHQNSRVLHTRMEGRHCRTACHILSKHQAVSYAALPPTASFPSLQSSEPSSLVREKRQRDNEMTQSEMDRSKSLKKKPSGDNNADERSSSPPPYSPSFFSRKPILVVYPSTSDSRFAESSSSNKTGTSSIMNYSVSGGAASALSSRGVTRGNPHSFSHFSSEEFSPPPLSEKTMDQCCHAVQHLLEMLLVKSRIRVEEKNVPTCTPDDGVNKRDPEMLASTGSTVAGTMNASDDFLAAEEGSAPPQNSDQDEGRAVMKKKPTEKEKEFFFNTNWRDDIERVLGFLSPILSVDFMVAMV